MNSEITLETKLVGEIKGSFYVPSYQRGYRWGADEVTRLLEDVYQNGKNNYCLQPIVVKRRADGFELIDGQQRLTTLYLIYRYIMNENDGIIERISISQDTDGVDTENRVDLLRHYVANMKSDT